MSPFKLYVSLKRQYHHSNNRSPFLTYLGSCHWREITSSHNGIKSSGRITWLWMFYIAALINKASITGVRLPHHRYFHKCFSKIREIQNFSTLSSRNHGAYITLRHYRGTAVWRFMGTSNIHRDDPKWRSLCPLLERRQIGQNGGLDHRGQGRTRRSRWETAIQPELQRYNLLPHIYYHLPAILLRDKLVGEGWSWLVE